MCRVRHDRIGSRRISACIGKGSCKVDGGARERERKEGRARLDGARVLEGRKARNRPEMVTRANVGPVQRKAAVWSEKPRAGGEGWAQARCRDEGG